MKMERRHFVFIADTLRQARDDSADVTAEFFADRLAYTNPNFDRDRFLRAAGAQEAT